VGDAMHFGQCVWCLSVIENELPPSHLAILRVVFIYWWLVFANDGWFVVDDPFFSLFISLSYPKKSTLVLIDVGVSDSII